MRAQSGSMRQILDMPTTPDSDNASTCGFFSYKGWCARGFRNLPHTSVGRFRKCGENPRLTDQTPVLSSGDLRFCCQKPGCARGFPIFSPHFRNNVVKPSTRKRETRQTSFGKQLLKRKNRLSAVHADQAGRTVARPHHSWHFKE